MADRSDDLQAIVDELATALRRSVAVDDPSLRLLAASRHFGDEDTFRVASILNRSVSTDVAKEVFSFGVSSWLRPGIVRIAGGRDRLCVPVRCQRLLLGFLWLLVQDQAALTDDEMDLTTKVAERAGSVLYRRLLLKERSRAQQEACLRDLISSDLARRSKAVDDIRDEQLIATGPGHYQVIALHPGLRPEVPSQDVALEAAIEHGRQLLPEGSSVSISGRRGAWLLVHSTAPLPATRASTVAKAMLHRFQELASPSAQPVAGLGSPVDKLVDTVESHHHAFLACRAALASPRLGNVVSWTGLDLTGMLLSIRLAELPDPLVVAGLDVLHTAEGGEVLWRTLEVYLRCAGDARRAADQLGVHRATLYNRVKKIGELTGRDLEDGDDRLLLHLTLKLVELGVAAR